MSRGTEIDARLGPDVAGARPEPGRTVDSGSDGLRLAVEGALAELGPEAEAKLFRRGRSTDPEVERVVASIVADVADRGDLALRELALRYDGVTLDALEVPAAECQAALDALEPGLRSALERAASAIEAFHRAQLPPPLEVQVQPGVRLGRRADPLRRVGVYAPGGRAAYPSSVLMGVVPARVAGVDEIVVCSPPGPDGRPPAPVLAACALAGADRVFSLGGAGAIAAMAHGTASVPRVDRIVGPGNAYVNEAKRQLNGLVGIDTPAGPSELLIVADGDADPDLIAVELLAQAEHDPDAAVALVTADPALLRESRQAIERRLADQPRAAIIRQALQTSGALLLAPDLGHALAFAEQYAPEHLLLLVEDPRAALERVRAAGTVFLGPGSSVAFGDYLTGANHVLPTGGLARAYSGLSVLDFLRFTTYQEVSDDGARALAAPTATLADAEGLPGHALAARLRGGSENPREQTAEQRTSGAPAATPATRATRPPAAVPLRAAYREVSAYDPARSPVEIDLSDNTNLFAASDAAHAAVAALGTDAFTRYPPVYADELKQELAALHGVAPENIATGCGLDDVIDSAIRAFVEPGDVVAFPEPTFGMIPLFTRMNAARPVGVPLCKDFALDPDALLAARARLFYVCWPNNPTGTLFDAESIERLAARSTGVILLDEAYADFAGVSLAAEAACSDRMIVLRTMSKAYGLAGLRIGYAIGPAPLIAEIEKSRGPYKVTATANAAALAAIREGPERIERIAREVAANRDRLTGELTALGLRVWPSAANFLLVQVPGRQGERIVSPGADRAAGPAAPSVDPPVNPGAPPAFGAAAFADALRARGVAVRAFPALPRAGDCIRVTIGPWPLMQRFLGAVRDVLREGSP